MRRYKQEEDGESGSPGLGPMLGQLLASVALLMATGKDPASSFSSTPLTLVFNFSFKVLGCDHRLCVLIFLDATIDGLGRFHHRWVRKPILTKFRDLFHEMAEMPRVRGMGWRILSAPPFSVFWSILNIRSQGNLVDRSHHLESHVVRIGAEVRNREKKPLFYMGFKGNLFQGDVFGAGMSLPQ